MPFEPRGPEAVGDGVRNIVYSLGEGAAGRGEIGERVLDRLPAFWNRIRKLPPGERFQTLHREQRNRPPAVKAAFLGVAALSLAGGVVLVFIPGPAVLLFALAGALLAAQSRRIAGWLDRGEVEGRRAVASVRRWRRRR